MTELRQPADPRPTRRTVTRVAAWTVPVVAFAAPAPAFAASPCTTTYTGVVSFAPTGNYVRSANTTSGSALVVPSPTTDTLLVSFDSVATGYTRSADNLLTNTFVTNELTLAQTRASATPPASANQTLTITFERPVTNVRFAIDGFSNPGVGGYIDTVYTSPTPTGFVNGADVKGAGTSGNPFQPNGVSTVFTGPRVTTTLTFAGPLTTLQIVYLDASTSSTLQEQAVGIGNITFNLKPTGC